MTTSVPTTNPAILATKAALNTTPSPYPGPPEISSLFSDFDTRPVFDLALDKIEEANARNFVLDFDSSHAHVAWNLSDTNVEALLARDKGTKTRWINVWDPELQPKIIDALAKKYGFSIRLRELMKMSPVAAGGVKSFGRSGSGRSADSERTRSTPHSLTKSSGHSSAVEDYSSPKLPDNSTTRTTSTASTSKEHEESLLNMYRLVEKVWHWSSIDWSRDSVCLGFNTLCHVDAPVIDPTKDEPSGIRLWSWLIFTSDATVISIHENPLLKSRRVACSNKQPSRWTNGGNTTVTKLRPLDEKEEEQWIRVIRKNMRNVFYQLSWQYPNLVKESLNKTERHHPGQKVALPSLNTVSIRPLPSDAKPANPVVEEKDFCDLLFYYLFDDWESSYRLISKDSYTYGARLEELRAQMFDKSDTSQVNDLHHYGRQLKVLERLYTSYSKLIYRLLQGTKRPDSSQPARIRRASHRSTRVHEDIDRLHPIRRTHSAEGFDEHGISDSAISETNEDVFEEISAGKDSSEIFQGHLSNPARYRFDRLRDRIELYVLGEITDCLTEKDMMSNMNFNLSTIRSANYVERLTRITILLAKVTIVFLPVTFMSSYFAIDLEDKDGYTVKQYWTAFAVIFAISVFTLGMFSVLSGTQEGQLIYEGLSKGVGRSLEATRMKVMDNLRRPRSESQTEKPTV